MSDKLIDLSGLEPKKLKRKRGKSQHGKSFVKYFKNSKDTKPEREVQQILRDLNIPFTKQFQIESKFYDIYIPMYNMLIEVDGLWWHGQDIPWGEKNKMQRKNYLNDLKKDGLSTKHGYNLIRIREDEINTENVRKLLEL